jgi:tetratricopeptide (TPR) repeat protein
MKAVDWPPQRSGVFLSATIFALALTLRVAYLTQVDDSPLFAHPIGDSAGFDAWAARIAAGDLFGVDPTDPGFSEQSAPIYPYYLGLVQKLVGRDYFRMRLVQMVIGACSCVVLYWAGRAFAGPAAGAVAATLLAIYPPAIFYDGQFQKGLLGLLFFCVFLLLMGAAQHKAAPGCWLGMGAALGLLSLDRENALVLVAVVLGWLAVRFRTVPTRTRMGWAAFFAAGLAATLLPAAFRNLHATGAFTLGTSNLGPNFYLGNNPRADGAYVALRPGHGSPVFERQDAREIAEEALGRELTPIEISDYWLNRGLEFVRNEPLAWARLMARKWALTWNRLEIADTEDLYLYMEWSPLLAGLGRGLHYGVVFPLAVAGLVWTWPKRRDLGILAALLLAMTAGVALFLVLGRYRHLLVPVSLIFVGAGLAQLPGLWRKGRRGLVAWGLAALFVAAVFSNWPMWSRLEQRATALTNLGAALNALERPDEAIGVLTEAISGGQAPPEAYHNLGNAWTKKGEHAKAIANYQRALQLAPNLAETHNNLGDALRKLGRFKEALVQYNEAAELRHGYAQPHCGAGLCLAHQGRHADAAERYRQAIRLDPDFAAAHNNLGNALSRLGRSAEALEAYHRALELDPHLSAAYLNLAAELTDLGRVGDAVKVLRAGLQAGDEPELLRQELKRFLSLHPLPE